MLGFSVQQNAFGRRSSLWMTAEEIKMEREIKVGVIGCGRIGLVHLEAITKAPGVQCVIVSNPTVSKAESGKKAIGSQSGFYFLDAASEEKDSP